MKRLRTDDGGAALVLVLLIVTVVAVVLGALLSLAGTSELTTVKLRTQAADAYGADGAMQTAINTIRNSTYNGTTGNCLGSGNTMTVPYGSGSAAVSCAPDPAKVTIHCAALTQCNRPGQAILTLGNTTGEDGLHIQQPNGSTFRVHGTIVSNSNINVANGILNTNTAVNANSGCSGTIQSTPAANCHAATVSDPGYSPATTTVPVYQKLPDCSKQSSLITFQPGYYDDAVGLTGMMSASSKCKNSTFWFTPGVYYFDFHNSGLDANSAVTSGSNIWTVDNGTMVAGTPVDSTGKVISAPSVPASIPGACDNPINDANAVGVQFIFGNDSQFAVKSGQVEICGTYSQTALPIAVYGLKSGSATTSTPTVTTNAVTPGQFGNATTTNLANLDGNNATWTTTNGNNQVGQVTLGYAAAIPAGSKLLSAALKIGHTYAPVKTKNATESLSVTVTPTGGSALPPVTVPAYAGTGGAEQTDTVDITSALAQSVHDNGFSGASVNYQATVGQAGTESLDGIQLVLSYIAPAFRAESGCVTNGPYTGNGNASTCALVTTLNNSGGLFYVQGTSYAPNAVLDITLNNVTEQIFRFGVIARSLWVKATGSFGYGGPVIEVPDDVPGFVFSVFLTVYVCENSPTCAAGGTPVLQSRVAFIDGNPATPVSGARQVAILSWSGNR